MRPRRKRFFLDIAPVVRRYDQDRNLISHELADLTGHLQPVHSRHPPVQKNDLIIVMSGMTFLHHPERLSAVHWPFHVDPDLTESMHRALTEVFVIIHNQHIPIGEQHILHPGLRLLQIQRHMEFRTLILLALNFNGSLHCLYDALRDRHSKASPLNLADLLLVSGKAVKNLFHKLRRHSDAGILYPEMASDIVLSCRRVLLGKIDIDPAVLRRELDCIWQEVQKHLVQAHSVAVYLLRLYLLHKNIKMLLLAVDLRLHDIYNAVHRIAQGKGVHIQRQLAVLNLRHIQHVIDQPEQMLAG